MTNINKDKKYRYTVRNVIYSALLFLSIINLCLFYVFWISSERIDASLELNENGYSYLVDKLSISITVLEAFLALIGIFLAVLAIFGYQQIKEMAMESAKKCADDFLKEHRQAIKDEVLQEIRTENLTINRASSSPTESVSDTIEDGNITKETEQENGS